MLFCKYCGKEFSDKGNLRKHELRIHEEPQEKVQCNFCGEFFSVSGLKYHKLRCKSNPDRIPTLWEEQQAVLSEEKKNARSRSGNCRFCGKECKNHNSLINHERLCPQNKDRKLGGMCLEGHPGYMKGKPAWNKGLTKHTDSRIAAACSRISEGLRNSSSSTGRASTPEKEAERRRKLSEYAKARNFGGLTPRSGRGKKGWYKGFFCDSTYELVYVIYNLDHEIGFKRCERTYEYSIDSNLHQYHPDFELADGSLVEIKGYHTDLVDIKLDAVKDRPIQVLYEKDLEYAFDWVREHYKYKNLYDLYDSEG